MSTAPARRTRPEPRALRVAQEPTRRPLRLTDRFWTLALLAALVVSALLPYPEHLPF